MIQDSRTFGLDTDPPKCLRPGEKGTGVVPVQPAGSTSVSIGKHASNPSKYSHAAGELGYLVLE